MQFEVGTIIEGTVTGITKFGAFVDIGDGKTGMVHISEVSSTYVENIADFLKIGQNVKVKVMSIGEDGKISLSIKRTAPPPPKNNYKRPVAAPDRPTGGEWVARRNDNMSFEDMMNRFKQTSDYKFSDLKRKNPGDSRRSSKRQKI